MDDAPAIAAMSRQRIEYGLAWSAVQPGYQRQGVGRQLLEGLEALVFATATVVFLSCGTYCAVMSASATLCRIRFDRSVRKSSRSTARFSGNVARWALKKRAML
jgi:ribosomal protein S18 acetylase RimI-like enzyme